MKSVCVCLFFLLGGATGLRFIEMRTPQFAAPPDKKQLLDEVREGAAPKPPAANSEEREEATKDTSDGYRQLARFKYHHGQLMIPNYDSVAFQNAAKGRRVAGSTCDPSMGLCAYDSDCPSHFEDSVAICMTAEHIPVEEFSHIPGGFPAGCGICVSWHMDDPDDPEISEQDSCMAEVIGKEFSEELFCESARKFIEASAVQACLCAARNYYEVNTACCASHYGNFTSALKSWMVTMMDMMDNQTNCEVKSGWEWCWHNYTLPNGTVQDMGQCIPQGFCHCMNLEEQGHNHGAPTNYDPEEACDEAAQTHSCAWICDMCMSAAELEMFGVVDKCASSSMSLDSAMCMVLLKKFNKKKDGARAKMANTWKNS